MMTTADLTYSAFLKALNTKFRLRVEEGSALTVELVEAVDELAGKAPPPGREAFSLLFRGEHPEPLSQGTYSLEHDDVGAFDLFLVPVRQDGQGFYYEAIFNRLGDA